MYKEELIAYLSTKNRRPQHFYHPALNEILAGIQDQLKQGKKVHFIGFGTFYVRYIKTSKEFPEIPVVSFKAEEKLRKSVKRKKLPEKKGIMSKIASFGKK